MCAIKLIHEYIAVEGEQGLKSSQSHVSLQVEEARVSRNALVKRTV